jgi:hypothetical protein
VGEEMFLLLVRKMTNTKIEQRTNIKFFAKLRKTATKTYQLLREVYGEDTHPDNVSLNGTEGL